VSKISPKKTKSNADAEKPQSGLNISTEKFFQAVTERRISDAEKELDGIRTNIPATESANGYLKALEGLLLTAKTTDDKYLYLSKIEMTPAKVKALRKEFAEHGTNGLHSDYDRGYFQAVETYLKKLERDGPPREAANSQKAK
jgi:hypothetical protein